MKAILAQLAVQLLPYVAAALGALLCILAKEASSYFKSKTTNTKVQGMLDRLDTVMEDAVKSTQQSVVDSIKPGDNLAQALASAKTAALDSVKSHFGEKGLEEVKNVLGWDSVLLEKNLSTKLEAKVHDLKLARAVVKPEPVAVAVPVVAK